MAKLGRRSKFNAALQETMIKLFEEGRTDDQVCEIIGVSRRTLNNWKGKHPDFLYALKRSKQIADDLVEASLFSRAVGYSHDEEKVFCHEGSIITHDTVKQYPPDVTAGIFWLKNRQPEKWREKMPGEEDKIIINNLTAKTDEELDSRIQELIDKSNLKAES